MEDCKDEQQEELAKAALLISSYCSNTDCSECKVKEFINCGEKIAYITAPYSWGRL